MYKRQEKAPIYLAYLKSGQKFPEMFDQVRLGSATIIRKDKSKVLGLLRKVRPIGSDEHTSHGAIIDKYGYECEWDETKLKSIAYRLQSIKYELVPEFIKKLVAAYFCGVLRFSSSIIWLRSTVKHRNRVRFYYCMAMASVLGLTAVEALNLTCCKNMSVRESNSDYLRLLKETELPSIREMASLDSVSVVKQIALMKPNWFRCGTLRQQTAARVRGESGLTTGIKPSCKNTLLEGLFNLKTGYQDEYGKHRENIKDKKEEIRHSYKNKIDKLGKQKNYNRKHLQSLYRERKVELARVDTPCLQYYFAAQEFCVVNGRVDYSHLIRAYTLRSRDAFACLDTVERVLKFKTPIRSAPALTRNQQGGSGTPIARRTRNSRIRGSPTRLQEATNRKQGESSSGGSSPRTEKVNSKRSRIILPCASWSGGCLLYTSPSPRDS